MTAGLEHGTASVALSFLVLVLGSLPVVLARPILSAIGSHYRLATGAYFLVSRLGLLAIFVIVLGRAAGPDSETWVLHGTSALQGLRPYIDYPSEYGPLFSYLLLPAFAVLPATIAPVAVFIIFDGLAFVLLHRVDDAGDIGRRAAFIYLVSPISWFMVVRYGQDEAIGALALVVLLLLDRRPWLWAEVVVAAVATIVTKHLFVMAAGAVLLCRPRAWLRCGATALLVACAYLPFLVHQGDFMLWMPENPLRYGPNVWQLIEPVFRIESSTATVLFLALSAVLGLLIMVRSDRITPVDAGLGLFGVIMLFSPKAWNPYALLFLPLFCLRVARAPSLGNLSLFALYGFLVNFYLLVYPALWMDHGAGWRVVARLVVVLLVASHALLLGRLILILHRGAGPAIRAGDSGTNQSLREK